MTARVEMRQKPRMPLNAFEDKMQERNLTLDGSQFLPDSTPMQPPLGFIKQPSMVDHIRNMIRSEQIRQAAESAGAETFEEADDFEMDEGDELPGSRYEMEDNFDPPSTEPATPQKPSVTPPNAPPAAGAEPGQGSEPAPAAPSPGPAPRS